MSSLKYLFIHYTETPEGREVSAQEILDWHTSPKPNGRGWSKAGYTDIIHQDGTISNITPFDQDDDVDGFEITNGAFGYNSVSRHIVYSGGTVNGAPADTRTEGQLRTMTAYCQMMVARHPHIKIGGHNQVSEKQCPGFDVPAFLRSIGIPEANIFKAGE